MQYRLDKFLSLSCQLTRQEAKACIKKKQVSVDGIIATKPEQKINPHLQTIAYLGKTCTYEPYVYYMLHKPAGVVSATVDNLHKTVVSLIDDPTHTDIFPVGRLDIDTEGLLLLTNDGELGHRLTSPAHHVDKCYEVEVNGRLNDTVVSKFALGIDIGEPKVTKPAKLIILSECTPARARVTIQEGKYHQIKRMFAKCGYTVTYLKRLSMGSLTLDETLAPGQYRALTEDEIQALKEDL
ncbi:16S rRNA pseudouridine516 synthase [Lachnospiraceae bacterium XBB1006]|nr:16S rRNA pseudouridine516 synthase [Lachnospiraceae bacterium XBB1006]